MNCSGESLHGTALYSRAFRTGQALLTEPGSLGRMVTIAFAERG